MKPSSILVALAIVDSAVAQTSSTPSTASTPTTSSLFSLTTIDNPLLCRGDQWDHYCCFDGTVSGPALSRFSSSVDSRLSAESSEAASRSSFLAASSASRSSVLRSLSTDTGGGLPTATPPPNTSISSDPAPTPTTKGIKKRHVQSEMSSGLTCIGFAAITLSASNGQALLTSAYIAADATRSTTVIDGSTSIVSVSSKYTSTASPTSSAGVVSMTSSSSTAGAVITQAPMVMACGAAVVLVYGAI